MRHSYYSTACNHEQHESCRKKCKFCMEPCRCECHGTLIYDGMTWVSRALFPRRVHQIGFNNHGDPVFSIRCKCGWTYMVARTTSTRREIVLYLRHRYKDHRKYGCVRNPDYTQPLPPLVEE